MTSTSHFLPLLASLLLSSNLLVADSPPRDPFWPIGYQPEQIPPTSGSQPDEPEEPQGRILSPEELRELARAEAARIRATLDRRGTMTAGDRIYAHVQGRWVTIGDSFTVQVEGQTYRLFITRLTPNDIELEPHRVASPTPNPGTTP